MARKINSRQIKQPQKRVIGAGITEFWYLKHLKPLLGFVYEMKPVTLVTSQWITSISSLMKG